MTTDRTFPPPDQDLTPPILRDHVHDALPHGPFGIDPMSWENGSPVLRIRCRCGRCLKWVGPLPSDLLLYWLADHDDDMFLTQSQLERKYAEQLQPMPERLRQIVATLRLPFPPI